VIACPRCGTEVPDGARFCPNCGNALGSVTDAEERKFITVLFCDLVGFTERSDRADPEDVKATLRIYHTVLKRVIDRYGGTVDKFIGDAVLGVFGAPVGYEDDPERAVHAALRIVDEIAIANDEHPGLELAVRIGVNTGEALVTFGQGPQIGESITGDVVNTASRLQTIAPAGAIVVGEATYHATSDTFEYEPLPDATVKGKAEPLAIWRPVGTRSRAGVDVRDRPHTPFVGRDDEAATLRQLWRKTIQLRELRPGRGSVQLATITGEPGVGKTRLMREFSAYLDELPILIRWRQGRCLPYGDGVGYWAFGEIVKSQAGILDSDPPEAAHAKLAGELERFVPDPGERDWVRTRMAPLFGSGEHALDVPRGELFAAWRRYVDGLAADGPLVLVFEDLHWADGSMLALIEDLVERSTEPYLILCAGRPEFHDRAPALTSDRPNAVAMELPPLSEAQTAVLLSSLMQRAVLPADVQSILIERSGGNPLFAEEFVQLLIDQGMVDREHPDRLLAAIHDIPVPESLQTLIGSRLDALPWADKTLLQDAAVVGKVFWSGALAAVAGIDDTDVAGRLAEAIDRDLIRHDRTSTLAGQDEYSFWHALIRDVAYGQIPRAGRERKHVAAARWLRSAMADRLADFAEELAYHYTEALDLAKASGERPSAELRSEAGEAMLLAGRRAAPTDAIRADAYYRRSLELLAADDPQRPRAAARAAETAGWRGNVAESEQLLLAAIAGYRVTGDLLGLGEALGILSRLYAHRGEEDRATAAMDEAVLVLESQPPSAELCRVCVLKAGGLLTGEQNEECIHWSNKALELAADLGLRDEAVRALQARGAALCELGDDEHGLADLREAIRLGREAGAGQAVAIAYGNYAYQLWFREGPAAALEVWEEMERLAEARGFTAQVQISRMGRMECLFDLGRWDELLELRQTMGPWSTPDELRTEVAVYARTFEAWVRLRRGEGPTMATFATDLFRDASRFTAAEYLAPAQLVVAEVRRSTGDLVGARELLDAFVELTETAPNYRALFAPVAARSYLALGDVGAAEAMLPDRGRAETERHTVSLRTARAIVAEARGRIDEALTGYRAAAERWRDHGFHLELAQTLTGAARCLLELGHGDEATELLLEARDILTRMRAEPALGEVQHLLDDPAEGTG